MAEPRPYTVRHDDGTQRSYEADELATAPEGVDRPEQRAALEAQSEQAAPHRAWARLTMALLNDAEAQEPSDQGVCQPTPPTPSKYPR
jgi:hypothetical protein